MDEVELVDSHGRHTRFRGEVLSSKNTNRPNKPHWTSIDVYRTAGGQYVVDQCVHYRVFHANERCPRLAGQILAPADDSDTWPCPNCCPEVIPSTGYRQGDKREITVCAVPLEVVAALSTVDVNTGLRHHGAFGQAVLRELSIKDPAIEQVWMYRRID